MEEVDTVLIHVKLHLYNINKYLSNTRFLFAIGSKYNAESPLHPGRKDGVSA